MATVETYRPLVVARAGGACEYCRLLQNASGVTFHVDHIVSKANGGRTQFDNLALSCPTCNLTKGDRLSGFDRTGTEQRLFNPRAYEPSLLGWHLHFILDRESGRIIARTATGEATIQALKINDNCRTSARKYQIVAGLIS